MIDGHPLVWLWLLLVVSSIALNTTNPLLLLIMAAALIATGFLVAGPRLPSFVAALGASLAATLCWALLTLVLPRGAAADAFLTLPSWAPGPGVAFGGPLDLGSVMRGLTGALRAVVVIVIFGLAGQLVNARGWLALARSTLGVGAPAAHPLATLGEATVDVALTRQRLRSQGWGRSASAGWLTSLLIAGREIARPERPHRAAQPGVEILRLILLLILGVGPALALSFGVLPGVVTANLFGTDMVAVVVALAAIVGLVLPGTPSVLGKWHTTDLPQAAVALLLTLGWALRGLLDQEEALFPAMGTPVSLPWAISGTIILLPIAIALSRSPASRPGVSAHA